MTSHIPKIQNPTFYVVDSREKLLKHLPKFVRDSILIFRRKADMSLFLLRKHRLIKILYSISHRHSFQDYTRPLFHLIIKQHGRFIKEVNSKFRRPGYFLSIGKSIKSIRNLRTVNLDLSSLANWKMFFYCKNVQTLSLWVLAQTESRRTIDRTTDSQDSLMPELAPEEIESSLPKWLRKCLVKLRKHLAHVNMLRRIRIDGQMTPLSCLLLRILSQSQAVGKLESFGLSLVEKIDRGLHESLKDLSIWQALTTLDYSTSINSNKMMFNLLDMSSKTSKLTRLLLTFDHEVRDWSFLKYVEKFEKLMDFNLTMLTTIEKSANSFLENYSLTKSIKRVEITIDVFNLEFTIDNIPTRERFIQEWKKLKEVEDVYLIISCVNFCEYHLEFYQSLIEDMRNLTTLHLVLQENTRVKTKHSINFAKFFRGIQETLKTVQDFHIDARRLKFGDFLPNETTLRECNSITLKGELEDFEGVNNFLTTLNSHRNLTIKMHKENMEEEQFFERLKLLQKVPNLTTVRMTFDIDSFTRKLIVRNIAEFVKTHPTLVSMAFQLDGIAMKPSDYTLIEEAFNENLKILVVRLTNDYYTNTFKKGNADDYLFEDE